jgi:mRNA interferase RelE/StbE
VARYRLLVKPSAVRVIEAIPRQNRLRIVAKISFLARDPSPPGCERLSGRNQDRLREGDHPILSQIEDLDPVVVVVTAGHRRDVDR